MPYDTIHGFDVSSLSLLQRRIFERITFDNAITAHALAQRLRSTDKSVINQVRAIRKKLGARVIITEPNGYRLGKQRNG